MRPSPAHSSDVISPSPVIAAVDGLDDFERAVDLEYHAPAGGGWQRNAAYLLLAHSLAVAQPRESAQDTIVFTERMKDAAMHSLRFMHACADRELAGMMYGLSGPSMLEARHRLDRGDEYDSIVAAFTQYRAGLFSIESFDGETLRFNPDDLAAVRFDLADPVYHDSQDFDPATQAMMCRVVELAGVRASDAWRILLSAPEVEELLAANAMALAATWQLPSEWSYRGLTIGALRSMWNALNLACQVQIFAQPAMKHGPELWAHLIQVDTKELKHFLEVTAGVTGLEAATFVDLNTYKREDKKSDISLTPLVAINDRTVLASPNIIATSRAERNFYAHVARNDPKEVDTQSHLLERKMTEDLAEIFKRQGHLVRSGVKVVTTLGPTDIDLLVYSPKESFVMAFELKWFIHAADYREVLNRHAAARESLRKQLPKYRLAVAPSDVCALLDRVFGSKPVKPVDSDVGLIMRNHVGHPSLQDLGHWFAPEGAFRLLAARTNRLRTLSKRLSSFTWLPDASSANIHMITTVTPLGRRIVSPGFTASDGRGRRRFVNPNVQRAEREP